MIEQITISVSSFEVQNQELRRQNDNLQQLLEAKTLQDSQRQLETKENNPRLSSKTSLVSPLKLVIDFIYD